MCVHKLVNSRYLNEQIAGTRNCHTHPFFSVLYTRQCSVVLAAIKYLVLSQLHKIYNEFRKNLTVNEHMHGQFVCWSMHKAPLPMAYRCPFHSQFVSIHMGEILLYSLVQLT